MRTALASLLAFLPPADDWDGLRSRIACAGDVNCDGTPDLLVAEPESWAGVVSVLCGRDGILLYTVFGQSQGDGFGRSLSGIGDVDDDGHQDFVVGAQRLQVDDYVVNDSGYASVFSGRDGKLLHVLRSRIADDAFGVCVAGGGDVDGDGSGDVVVTSGGVFSDDSRAYAFSGRGGELLGELSGGCGLITAALCPDLDGDGLAEVILGRGMRLIEGSDLRLQVRLGLKREIATVDTSFQDCSYPIWAVSGDGDADGDGINDVLVSRIDCGADVFSGRTRELFHSIPYGRHTMVAAGSSLDWVGDIDQDGGDDFVLAANEGDWAGPCSGEPGFARVYSGRTGEILRTFDPGRKRMDACRAGDANRDGIPDLAVFVVEDRAVRVLSGRDLGPLWEVRIDELPR